MFRSEDITKEASSLLASECFNRNEFRLKYSAHYYKSLKENWIIEFFPKKFMRPEECWTKETLLKESVKYNTRNSFKWGSWNAYHAARRKPYFEEICAHMYTISKSDKNVVYLLKLEGYQDIYKIGITSQRCLKRRVAELKYNSKITMSPVLWINCMFAEEAEKEALMYGTSTDEIKFRGGYSEIRKLSHTELNNVTKLLCSWGGVL